jgi:putative endonuclease
MQFARHRRSRGAYGCSMTLARQRLGRLAEGIVADRLEAAGWRIVARNARASELRGEIDLIALDGTSLVFVEVKAQSASAAIGPELPGMAVGARKRARLRALAVAWLRDPGSAVPGHRGMRFDVVGLRFDGEGDVVYYDHLRGAF